MSASSMSGQAHVISVVIAEFRELHQELRLELANRDDESLNWIPCSGANSAATIVTHTLGSEAETLRAVARYLQAAIETASSRWAVRAKRTYSIRFAVPISFLTTWYRHSLTIEP